MKKICVIIPCYNEAQRLELEVFREFVGREERFDFCFVNDGSQDNYIRGFTAGRGVGTGAFLAGRQHGQSGERRRPSGVGCCMSVP